jgi:hypothetical protein
MEFKKSVKKILEESPNVFADKITCKSDGSIEVKRSYFYRHNMSVYKWAEKVKAELETNGLTVDVSNEDRYNVWPKESWFVAIVREA